MVMGQVRERPQWLSAALPSARRVAESFHMGSDWRAVYGRTGTWGRKADFFGTRSSEGGMTKVNIFECELGMRNSDSPQLKCFYIKSYNLATIVPTKNVAKFTGAIDNHDSHL